MPNHMMKKGIKASTGSVRSICMGASIAYSPARDRPDNNASPPPTSKAMDMPLATRMSETRR